MDSGINPAQTNPAVPAPADTDQAHTNHELTEAARDAALVILMRTIQGDQISQTEFLLVKLVFATIPEFAAGLIPGIRKPALEAPKDQPPTVDEAWSVLLQKMSDEVVASEVGPGPAGEYPVKPVRAGAKGNRQKVAKAIAQSVPPRSAPPAPSSPAPSPPTLVPPA